jgi:para-aminobenzoate synthetase component 1
MPAQEVALAVRPSALLLGAQRRRGAVLLDGGGPASWLHGDVVYADTPCATLTVYPSGWAHWCEGTRARWSWGDPLAQWEAFLAAGAGADGGAGGVLSVLSYELKHWIERLPRRHRWPRLPVVYCARYDWAYRASHRTGAAAIGAADPVRLRECARWYERTIATPTRDPRPRVAAAARRRCPRPTLRKSDYVAMIRAAQASIAAGEVYEINLAQRFTADATPADAPALFAAWPARYPMPFAAYVDGGDWAVVANSPECLLATDGAHAATFPIKGTWRCAPGDDPDAVAAALRADPKECAEHVMVVDLERNDLGRVCTAGSVAVAALRAVQHYPALAHMVSEVRGELRPGTSLAAVLRAIFPGGSITGAPKVRAMQRIEELEPAARGFYTGAIGWTEPSGAARFAIAIRTALLDATGLTYWAGGGIVADSDPEREFEEILLKSETFFRAWTSLEGRPV